ncbi:MAG: SDR family NAD(P)-dependent oxidoreductase [Candidatus Baldrarchaeia archaeon]
MFVLVTGGAGFIGSFTVERLVGEGFRVRVFDNFSYGRMENLRNVEGRVEVVRGDVKDLGQVCKAVRGVDAVIHLAGLVSVEKSFVKPWETNEVNVTGTINMLKACIENKVKRFVYGSSAAVYGNPKYLPIDEEHPKQPISPYGASKLASELYIKTFSEKIETVILRYFNVYGPRQNNGVIKIFVENILKGEPLVVYGDGKQTRDFIYVEDVAEANQRALENSKVIGEEINIATGKPTKIKELTKLLNNAVDTKVKIRYLNKRVGEIKHSYADVEKAVSLLKFKAKTNLEEGLGKMLEYLES